SGVTLSVVHSSAHPLDVHSFPTRRSSDLVMVGLPFAVALSVAAWRLLPAGTFTLGRGLPSVISARGAIGASFIASEAYLPLLLQDRKSTRLNSSHVKISYAVFCLKKTNER